MGNEKTRTIWVTVPETNRLGTFLHLCVNDSYTMNMGDVDVAYQLQGSYRPGVKWIKKMK